MAVLPGDAISPNGTQGFVTPLADRPTVSYKGGISQEAGIGAGEAMGRFGMVGLDAAMQIQDTQDKLAAAAAEQNFLSKKLDLDQQFATDKDPSTAPQRYRAALQGALADTSQGITGNVQRADYQNRMSRWVEYGTNSMLRTSVAQWKDQGKADTIDALDNTVNNALRAPDEPTRTALFGAAHDHIDAAEQSGWFTHAEAAKLRQTVPQAYALKRATMMADADPASAVSALQPSGISADGTPTFDKTGDWRDYLDPAKRMDVVRAAQAHAQTNARADEVEAERQQRVRDKAEKQAADNLANSVVTQLATDPTKVDPKAIANDPRFPASQWHVKEALINMTRAALQRDDGKDTKTYGPGFYGAYQQVHAPDGDPNKITDPAQLYSRAGPNGDLTVAGVDKLTSEINGKRSSPEGEAESKMKAGALAYAKHQLSFEADYGTFKIPDPKGQDAFNVGFLPAFYQAYDSGIKAGKSPGQLLSKDSPDFIVDKVMQPFKRSQAEFLKDRLDAGGEAGPQDKGAATEPDLSTPQGIVAAFQSGRMSRAAAEAEALKRGFIKPGPQAAAAPSAPIR